MSEPVPAMQLPLDLRGLALERDPWLSTVVGERCFNVRGDVDAAPPTQVGDDGVHGPAFVTARAKVTDLSKVQELTTRGFRLVDTSLVFRQDAGVSIALPVLGPPMTIAEALPEEANAVATIAVSSFRYSRFHLDPLFSASSAERVKANWAVNLAVGARGSGCLVARQGDKITGFLGYIRTQEVVPELVIDLIAVHPTHRQGGVGTRLVRAASGIARESGIAVRVGTQLANLPSIRFYERLGFRMTSAAHVFHGHLVESGVA